MASYSDKPSQQFSADNASRQSELRDSEQRDQQAADDSRFGKLRSHADAAPGSDMQHKATPEQGLSYKEALLEDASSVSPATVKIINEASSEQKASQAADSKDQHSKDDKPEEAEVPHSGGVLGAISRFLHLGGDAKEKDEAGEADARPAQKEPELEPLRDAAPGSDTQQSLGGGDDTDPAAVLLRERKEEGQSLHPKDVEAKPVAHARADGLDLQRNDIVMVGHEAVVLGEEGALLDGELRDDDGEDRSGDEDEGEHTPSRHERKMAKKHLYQHKNKAARDAEELAHPQQQQQQKQAEKKKDQARSSADAPARDGEEQKDDAAAAEPAGIIDTVKQILHIGEQRQEDKPEAEKQITRDADADAAEDAPKKEGILDTVKHFLHIGEQQQEDKAAKGDDAAAAKE